MTHDLPRLLISRLVRHTQETVDLPCRFTERCTLPSVVAIYICRMFNTPIARSGDSECLKHSSDHNQHSLGKVDIYRFKCMSSFIHLEHVGIVLGLETAVCAKQVGHRSSK